MKKIDLFFCTKPLQYLNARNIPFKINDHKKVLLLVNKFYKAREYYGNIKLMDKHWDNVVFFESTLSAYFYLLIHNVKTLYISYDNGTMIGIFYHIKHFNLYVLEEGAATYIDIKFKKNKVRRFFDNCLGVSPCWGHSDYLKGAYVYYPTLYKQMKKEDYEILPFENNFQDAIKSSYNLFLKISSTDNTDYLRIQNSKILIYLVDWNVNYDIINKMKSVALEYDFVYVKPHPHSAAQQIEIPFGMIMLRTNLMIEFVFSKWIDNNNEVTVFHEGTSAIFYYNNYVSSVDMSTNKNSEYNQFIINHIIT